MPVVNDRLEEIRRMQGLPPLPDPGKIDAAPDLLAVTPEPLPDPDDLEREAYDPADQYDLLPDEEPEPPGRPIPPTMAPQPDLAVISSQGQCGASLLGRDVALSAQEEARVKAIVIQALRRDLREREREIIALLPKRKRKRAAESPTSNAGAPDTSVPSTPSPSTAKKRGRPRRQRLDGGQT